MQLNDEEKIVQNKSYENPCDRKQCSAWQARSHKFAIEGASLGAEPPAAGGYWGIWEQGPQRLKILHFFFKNNLKAVNYPANSGGLQ